jgi:serine/threonine-protein kinase
LFGAAGIVWQSRVAARERDRAREEAKRAGAVKDYLLEVFSAVDPMYESGASLTALELAERGASQLADRFESDPVIRAEIAQTLGKVMMSLASYERADTLLSAALELHRRSDDPERVVQTLIDLGEVARWRAELDEAGRHMEEAVATANAELSPENPWVAKSYASLAVVRAYQDRYDEAEVACREGIRLTRIVNGPGSLIEGEHLSNLAMIMKEKGELHRTERLLREAVEIYRTKGAAANELTMAAILGSLGDTLDDLDQLEEGEAACREAIAIMEREYGEEGHPDLAMTLSNLGGTVRRLRRLEEAETIQLRALEIFKRHLGEEHFFVARLYSNLSVTRMDMGDLAGAEKLQADAIRLMKKQLGERHSSLLGPMNNHGNVLSDLGREAESEAQYRESLSIAVETFGEKSLQASYPLLGLASVLRKTGRLEESERLARESWEIREGVVGSGHSLELSARISVASSLRLRGRTSEARELLDSAVEEARAGLPATQGVLTRAEAERAKLPESRED